MKQDSSLIWDQSLCDYLPKKFEPNEIDKAIRERFLSVIELRRKNLAGCITTKCNGRILWFVPAETLSDGLAEESSAGLFDVHNVPCWELWIGWIENPLELSLSSKFKSSVLLSWVPEALCSSVTEGIDVHAEGCFDWVNPDDDTLWLSIKNEMPK